jgi:phage portal protein BeeE
MKSRVRRRRPPAKAARVVAQDNLNAATFGQPSDVGDERGWFVRAIGPRTNAGVRVSEFLALNLPVVYACVNRVSNPVSRFPVAIMRRLGDGSRRPAKPNEHPMVRSIAGRPNPFMSSRTVRKTTQGHALLWGNGYIEIERNNAGQAVGLWPMAPWNTRPVRENGQTFYRSTVNGQQVKLATEDVIHLMDQSTDGYIGLSQIALARQAIGWGLAMEEFGAKFFGNDAKSGGFLTTPGRLTANARQNLASGRDIRSGRNKASPESPAVQLEEQGGIENAHRVKVLEEGVKFIQTTIPPDDAQFLGSREFQLAEMARIYDVPLVMLQSNLGGASFAGAGIEQLLIWFIRSTIDPWINAWEQELNYKLFTEEEIDAGFYVNFNMNAMMRGDMAARAEFYKSMFGVGGLSTNQILALEDMDGVGAVGDFHFVPANYVTLERATDPNYTPMKTPPVPPVPPGDPQPANDPDLKPEDETE